MSIAVQLRSALDLKALPQRARYILARFGTAPSISCNYGVYGDFSPTTLRYVKVASDLLTLFGPLETAQMIEIGGGYGGQCYVTSVALSFSSYTLVDLDPVLELQRVYLRALRIPSVRFVSPRDIDAGAEYDLVVSNFAFSECVRRVQKFYIERVLSRSRCGYVACNWLRPRTSLTKRELLEAVPGSRFVRDNEGAPSGFDILVWGSG